MNENLVVEEVKLLLTSSPSYIDKLSYLKSIEIPTVYLTVNKSGDSLDKNFSNPKIHYVDCLTEFVGLSTDNKNVTSIESPSALTLIGIALSELKEKTNFKLIVIDSLSSLKVYNAESAIIKFARHIIQKFSCDTAIHIISQKGDQKLNESLGGIVDRVVEGDENSK